MTGEQLQRAVQFADPLTAEVLTLDSESGDLARFLTNVRELESVLREHKRMVTRELLTRMDRSASWTMRVEGGLKITGQSPAPAESWDGAELRTALLELVDAGVLAVEAVDAAVETVVSYRPRKAGITALRKLGGDAAAVVERLCVVSEPERRVSVSRTT